MGSSNDDELVVAIHEAMNAAPFDGQLYRRARAALATMRAATTGPLEVAIGALERCRDSGVTDYGDFKHCKHCNRFQDDKNKPSGHAYPDDAWTGWGTIVVYACVEASRALATIRAAAEAPRCVQIGHPGYPHINNGNCRFTSAAALPGEAKGTGGAGPGGPSGEICGCCADAKSGTEGDCDCADWCPNKFDGRFDLAESLRAWARRVREVIG